MTTLSPLPLLLLVSALLFLGTAGHLVVNAGALAELFGRKRADPAHEGAIVSDPRGRRKQASRGVILASLALHVIGIAGLVLGTLALAGVKLGNAPGEPEVPAEMNPAPTAAPAR